MHIRCPHCHQPVELVENAPLEQIDCPSCGSHFSRLGDPTFLDSAGGHGPDLREQVQGLLRAHSPDDSELESPPNPIPSTLFRAAPLEGPGTVIGSYKLMEQIGEGGMGLVFVAEQQRPVRRKVALKVIKPGMDTREVIARFEAERQALALMDHPHIARVLDAGATDAGRPFFVMELVRGSPITTYCDQSQRATNDRLKLFISVCRAAQHAHQKGIIHRDLKPSNILVSLHDSAPVVKVIDFGLAKAINRQLTERTVYTAFSQMLGTPIYMSPEQAGLSDLDVDTRTDIYSLGVVLYELLTGTTPFEQSRLHSASYDEIRRIIREEEPPKPSARISTLGRAATTLSARRGSAPQRLSQLLRKDLDWIVMKALEKDRDRRYESAAAFAADVERFLNDQPVLACPPSATYRFRKFARRNKKVVRTLVALGGMLLLGLGMLAASNVRLRSEQARTVTEYNRAESLKVGADELRADAENRLEFVLKSLDDIFVKQAESLSALRRRAMSGPADPEREAAERAFLERGLRFYEQLAERPGTSPEARREMGGALRTLGMVRHGLGELAESERAQRQSIQVFEKLQAEFPGEAKFRLELAESHLWIYFPLKDLGRRADAEQSTKEALALFDNLAGELPGELRVLRGLADGHDHLCLLQANAIRLPDAARNFELAAKYYSQLAAQFPRETNYREFPGGLLIHMAFCKKKLGRQREAAATFQQAADVFGGLIASAGEGNMTTNGTPTPPEQIGWFRHEQGYACVFQGDVLREMGDLSGAEAAFHRGLAAHERLVADFPRVRPYKSRLSWNWQALGILLKKRGENSTAEQAYLAAVAAAEQAPVGDNALSVSVGLLATLYQEGGRVSENIELWRKATEQFKVLAAEANDRSSREWLAGACEQLGGLLNQAQRTEEAEAAYRKADEAWKTLIADFPAEQRYRSRQAWCGLGFGNVLKSRGDHAAAEQAYRDAAKTAAEQGNSGLILGVAYENLGDLYAAMSRFADAIDVRKLAVAAWEERAAETNERDYRRHLADACARLGLLLRQVNRADEAKAACKKCEQVWEKLAADVRPDLYEVSRRTDNLIRLGELHKTQGNRRAEDEAYVRAAAAVEQGGLTPAELASAYEALSNQCDRYTDSYAATAQGLAVTVWKKLAAETNDRGHRQHLADAYLRLGTLLKRWGRNQDATDACLKARGVLEQLAADFGRTGEDGLQVGRIQRALGDAHAAAGEQDAAEQAYRAAAEMLEKSPADREALREVYEVLGKLYETNGRMPEALEAQRKSVAIREELAAELNVPDQWWHLARHCERLGALLKKADRTDEAAAAFGKAGAIWERLVAEHPAVADYRWHLAINGRDVCDLLSARGMDIEAIALTQKGVALWEALVGERDLPYDSWNLVVDCERLGNMLERTGGADANERALAAYGKARAALEKLVDRGPGFVNFRPYLAKNLYSTRELLTRLGRAEEADELAKRSKAVFQPVIDNREQMLRRTPNDDAALNALAWDLAAVADARLRDPPRAVELAKRAVELRPENPSYWNTLGVAQYRSGDWPAAIESLMKSDERGSIAKAHDWFVLAMAHWRLGHQDDARAWFDKAVAWMNKNQPNDAELRRFHAEAKELLSGDAPQ